MTYPQQPQQPGYGPPAYPQKKKTGLIVGIVAAVVLVVGGVLVTGFVAPGFFLSEEKAPPPGPQPGPVETPPSDTPGGESLDPGTGSSEADVEEVESVAATGVEAINNRDGELAKTVSCDPANAGDTSDIPPSARAEVSGEPQQSGAEEFRVPVKFSVDGQSTDEFLNVLKKDGRWCIDG